MERVQKIIANFGYCSRRKAEELINQGKVFVNGKKISIGDKASEKDEIKVEGEILKKPKTLYLLFHKPVKCVTALMDAHYKTVMDYIKIKERVVPVGRLDYYTSGLLLMTNDGDFANKVMHPRYEVNKTYRAEVDKKFLEEDLKKIETGIKLEDGITSPAKAHKIKENLVEIEIHEGKNRIVRRMLKQLGYRIKTLERTKIGELSINGLRVGEYKEITKEEAHRVFSKTLDK
ncbi:MAG: pseudouridine synthase [Nanoarchaeota archaeon]|nr:rRNA pseudouridine synthase [Nanoarchaeota archaeon]